MKAVERLSNLEHICYLWISHKVRCSAEHLRAEGQEQQCFEYGKGSLLLITLKTWYLVSHESL